MDIVNFKFSKKEAEILISTIKEYLRNKRYKSNDEFEKLKEMLKHLEAELYGSVDFEFG